MGFKKWIVSNYDKELAKELAIECDVDPIVALIASSRGYSDPMDLEQFLSDEPTFSEPRAFADIEKAAQIVNTSIENGEKIAIYGDYDCDGVTATAILYTYLTERGADCIYYIPDRFDEGYGMNCNAVKELKNQGVELIITVDNGISCIEEISLAKSLGIKTVVTDHHLPKEVLPNADAVVDPHRTDCTSEFKEICGAQVAFALICVMEEKEPEELIYYFADILAVAVIADIMPLTLENRSIVKCGIDKLKTSANKGLSALLSVAGIEKEGITSSKIAFGLSPRINAAGRMGKAQRAVELLTTDSITTAISIANEIDGENSLRQKTEKDILEQALSIIEKEGYANHRIIVVKGKNWHHGVMGIVASRIAERYGVPSILISSDGEMASGSGRSIEGFSLYNAINHCSDLLIKFGGHSQAAGISLRDEDVDKFREKINLYAKNTGYVAPILKLDCKLNPSVIDLDLCFALKQLEPFGMGNTVPVFGIYDAFLEDITPLSNGKHLRLSFLKGDTHFKAILFGVSKENFCFSIGDALDLAVTAEANYFRDSYSVSVQIKALRMSGTDDDALFSDIVTLKDFLSGGEYDANNLLPLREETVEIYKAICKEPLTEEKIKYRFLNTIGLGKTVISLKSLEELKLIIKNFDGTYIVNKNAEKTSLDKSEIIKKLKEGRDIND